jgi:hemerythrin-like metal-binding protein
LCAILFFIEKGLSDGFLRVAGEFFRWFKNNDEEHKKMIGILNHLHDVMKEGKASKEVGNVINEMIGYTKYHFASEEKLMAEANFSGLASQKAEHAAFIKKSLEFQSNVTSGKLAVSIDVLTFLKDWWTNHILIVDKKYAGKLSK